MTAHAHVWCMVRVCATFFKHTPHAYLVAFTQVPLNICLIRNIYAQKNERITKIFTIWYCNAMLCASKLAEMQINCLLFMWNCCLLVGCCYKYAVWRHKTQIQNNSAAREKRANSLSLKLSFEFWASLSPTHALACLTSKSWSLIYFSEIDISFWFSCWNLNGT